jgi:ribosome-associated protein
MKITHIVQDTREQKGKHKNIESYMRGRGIEIIRDKVYAGDYTLPTDRRICIDVKRDIMEIAGNICGNEHERFRDELKRAQETGTKLYILIEQMESNGKLIIRPEDLHLWEPPKFRYGEKKGEPRTLVKGEPLGKAMRTMEKRYGCEFLFCDSSEAGFVILRLLKADEEQICP